MSAENIPTIVKHVALAIYASGWVGPDVKNPGSGQTAAFTHCLEAARWRLVQYGYLRAGSQHGPPSNIKLTAKGQKRDKEHRRESDFKIKEEKFRKLYELIDTEVENPVGDREESDADPKVSDASYEEKYKAEQQARRADVAAKQPPPRSSNKIKKARTRRVRRRW